MRPEGRAARRKHCGTRAALASHLRRGERPCAACLVASHTYTDAEIAALIQEQREHDKSRRLWQEHGITLATFERAFIAQGSCCACCRSTDSKTAHGWSLDLDHDTRTVRGILCADCDAGIKLLGDCLKGVQRAATYLQPHAPRGEYPRDLAPPSRKDLTKNHSARIQHCFALFEQGITQHQVVIQLREHPDTVRDIHALWKTKKLEDPST